MTPTPPEGFQKGGDEPCLTKPASVVAPILESTTTAANSSLASNAPVAVPSPDQGPEHNPDNLSPEKYGAPEWRLLRVGEGPRIGDEVYHGKDSWRTVTWKISGPLSNAVYDTYRRRVAPEPEQARNNALRDNPYTRMKKECICPPEGMVGDPDCPIHNDRGPSIYAPPVGARELAKNYTDALEYIGRLKTQLAASEKDRERLDWLERIDHQKQLFGNWIGGGGTLRAAIDAAMKEAK